MSKQTLKLYKNLISRKTVSEEEIHQFLVDNPSFLPLYYPVDNILFSKLKLGNQFVVDFAFARLDSSGVNWNFIEIEKPQFPQFKASGDVSPEFSHGLRQLADWNGWLTNNRDYFINNYPFKREMQKRGIAHIFLTLIIGRRNNINEKNRELYRQLNGTFMISEVMSFDRLASNSLKCFDSSKPLKVCSFVNGEINILKEDVLMGIRTRTE